MATKKLTRSHNKSLAGVCAGIAEYINVDPTLVRICYLALTIFSAAFPGLLLYIIMALVMPENIDTDGRSNDDIEEATVVE